VPTEKINKEQHDPRFDERAGKLNKDLFKKSFSFVEEIKKDEKSLVVKEAKKTKDPEKKEKLKRLLQQMVSR
jgi:ribosomal RNA-processing protein 36